MESKDFATVIASVGINFNVENVMCTIWTNNWLSANVHNFLIKLRKIRAKYVKTSSEETMDFWMAILNLKML